MLCGLVVTSSNTSSPLRADLDRLLDAQCLQAPTPETPQRFLPGPDKDELARRFTHLQGQIQDNKIDWYIVPSEDAHQSEEVAMRDKRREWLSGFTGSAGVAAVPRSEEVEGRGLLFVDSRYWVQAAAQVDAERWEVRKVVGGAGEGGRAGGTWVKWAQEELREGSRIGIDPKLISAATASSLSTSLESGGSKLVPISTNLIDSIRDAEPAPQNAITHHPLKFSGESTSSKLARVRAVLDASHSSSTSSRTHPDVNLDKSLDGWLYILPGLPSIAWLLNIRCDGDVPYCPVTPAYVVLSAKACAVFIHEDQLEDAVRADWDAAGVRVDKYGVGAVGAHVAEQVKGLKEGDEKRDVRVYGSGECSWALSRACEPNTLQIIPCPVFPLQALKNETEQAGLRAAYLRDGAAFVRWIAWLEGKLLKEKRAVGEWAAAMALGRYRRSEENFAGLAYEDISASGPNGALPHYAPQRGTDRPIDPDSTYVIDSGAQYLDGTIDTTRTIYYGDKPSDEIKRAYTRVLQGHMTLSATRFPRGMPADWFNFAARSALYADELDFGHGVGHGVGSYLGVHEHPVSFPHNFSFAPGHVTTVEPGYYKEGEFGIRIESLLLCREKKEEEPQDPKDPDPEKPVRAGKDEGKWLEWERITQVPIQTSMVDWTLTTKDQIRWLNAHNTDVETALTPLLQGDEDAEARDWLKRACKPKKIWPWTGA